MRAVVQRASRAALVIDGGPARLMGPGLVVLLGVTPGDDAAAAGWLAAKIARLRIFDDADGRMNLALTDTGGDALVVSQFTLYGNVRKGTRPSWNDAARPEVAEPLYEAFVAALRTALGREVLTGRFGAYMAVELVNDGPVTLIIEASAGGGE